MDLPQPHSVPAAFGSSTPTPPSHNLATPSSVDDSNLHTVQFKTPPPTFPSPQQTTSSSQKPTTTAASRKSPHSIGGGSSKSGSPRGVKRKTSLTRNATPASGSNDGSNIVPPPNKTASNSPSSFAVKSPLSNSNYGNSSAKSANQCVSSSGGFEMTYPTNANYAPTLQQMKQQQQPSSHLSTPPHNADTSLAMKPSSSVDSFLPTHSSSSSPQLSAANQNKQQSTSSRNFSSTSSSSFSSSPNSMINNSTTTSISVVRLFSTSMLHRAESFISKGIFPNLDTFHANESQSFKFLNPSEDDKTKLDIKLEAQQSYCNNKANTAIANMKALTDSIPTPRSWNSSNHHSMGGSMPPPSQAGSNAPPNHHPHSTHSSMMIDANNINSNGGGNVMTGTGGPTNGGGMPSHGAPSGGGVPLSHPGATNPTSGSLSIKQETDLSRATSSSTSAASTNSQSSSSSNLSQDLLSKRAMKTEYLKTLKKSLLDDEMHLNESKHMPSIPSQQPQLHMNPGIHPQHRMMHFVGPHGVSGPPNMMPPPHDGGNQTANAVAMAAASRAAAIRQQDFIRHQMQHQQQQHNHANCVQGMCMHQMGPREPLHPMSVRQMMAMNAPPPYMSHMGTMHPSNPNYRMTPPSHVNAGQHMMNCRPGCNINHSHIMPPGGGMFMSMGGGPPMYSQNPRLGGPMMVPPNGVEPSMMSPTVPHQPPNAPLFPNMQTPNGIRMQPNSTATPVRQMIPFVGHPPGPNGVGGPPEAGMYNSQGNAPGNNAVPMSYHHQRPPAPSNGGGGGNNPMINVIMTIGGSNGSNQNMNNQLPQQQVMPPQGQNYVMQSTNGGPMGVSSSGNSMPLKQENPNVPGNSHGHQHFPNSMYPMGQNNQEMPISSSSSNFNSNSYQQQNIPNDGNNPPDYYSQLPPHQMHQHHMEQQNLQPPGDPGMMGGGINQPPFDMDDTNNHPSMLGSDQRQISVNVDKNMFMVQSNLNGAQFNVQGSALPQGSNVRTNVAVNMQVQSNRYPNSTNGNGNSHNNAAQFQSQQPPMNYKYGSNFDPAGQGATMPNWGGQPWQGSDTPQHYMQRASSNLEMYSNLSDFKPISDTPKGTVEYLPDGKTREKTKDHIDYSGNPANGNNQLNASLNAPSLPPHSSVDMVGQSHGMHVGPPSDNNNPNGGPQMLIPNGQGGPLFDPSSTFNDLHFTAM